MLTFKIQDPALLTACKALRVANAMAAQSKKEADAAKAVITQRLKELRGIDIATLSIGDMVNIENTLLLECGKQNRFDSDSFQLKHPALFAEFKKDFPTLKFKSLV